ncbi:MAG: SPOR domain-containing protein [Gammaproteobacteria bacterium]|nr:SPOR domain-containing protein [Gammaproteobacteria bacterium]
MDESLKQRLVGATVLVALAVIIVPFVFDGAGRSSGDVATFQIPPKPEFSPRPLQKLDDLTPVLTPAEALAKDAGGNSSEAPAKGGATPHAWVVQLGAFSSEANAIVLRDKLRSGGHSAFVDTAGDKSKYRVRIGPEIDKAIADKLRDKLAADYGQTGIVVRYP